ncbi:unnamed protein product [Hymenolepis diminuta]|uniref:Uncharacterized protein n=1 Tax=Hymenolepis diminuta TaxID=6216 RepID=A0A0R3S9M4_HYMDI|nr:unnamed protein product [Hymenolepis diminuta]VUZ56954.1 unnamed protein product [Hymenolepis diminuta]
MKCETVFKGKTEAMVCNVADRDINLLKLDWIDMFSVHESKIQTVICQQMHINETIEWLAGVLEDTLGTCT